MSEWNAPAKERAARLRGVRKRMLDAGLDAYIVRGTDRYLNEYVPIDESMRAWLSGFSGSVADLLLTKDKAFIFVDGRYYLQADQETDPSQFSVERVPLGTSNEQRMYQLMCELGQSGVNKVGYEPDRFSVAEYAAMTKATEKSGLELLPFVPSLVEQERGALQSTGGKLRVVSAEIAGRSVEEKLAQVRAVMAEEKLDAMVFQALDDIAYLSNMRGTEIAYQATFKAIAVLTNDDFALALPGKNRGKDIELSPSIRLIDEQEWTSALPATLEASRVGFDRGSTTEATRLAIAETGALAVPVPTPVHAAKAHKNSCELRHMIQSFRKADKAIWAVQSWLHKRVDGGEKTTEFDLAQEMTRRFKRSGGQGLSFSVIAAVDAHGAIIHYSDPDAETAIDPGALVLLDTGTFYDGGYATDLTRTFVAGRKTEATARQQFLFTTVLKGAIAGMAARIPVNTKGYQLDAMCRAPMWNAGLQFLHGTGHGVGINVHEMPPRVSPISDAVLEPGHIFSIEPGVYIEGEGGVRIENLCTVVPDPELDGFLRVVPLTFSPLDKRLIDPKLLSKGEKEFLKWFAGMWKRDLAADPVIPDPPPLL